MKRAKGFTLVELAVTLSIIGIGLSALMKLGQVQVRRNTAIAEQRLLGSCIRQFLLFYQTDAVQNWTGTWYTWCDKDTMERKFTRIEPEIWDFRLDLEDQGRGYNIRFFDRKRGSCLWTWWVYKHLSLGLGGCIND